MPRARLSARWPGAGARLRAGPVSGLHASPTRASRSCARAGKMRSGADVTAVRTGTAASLPAPARTSWPSKCGTPASTSWLTRVTSATAASRPGAPATGVRSPGGATRIPVRSSFSTTATSPGGRPSTDGYAALDPSALHRRSVLLDRASRSIDIIDEIDGGECGIRLAFHLGPDVQAELEESCAVLDWPAASTPGGARWSCRRNCGGACTEARPGLSSAGAPTDRDIVVPRSRSSAAAATCPGCP